MNLSDQKMVQSIDYSMGEVCGIDSDLLFKARGKLAEYYSEIEASWPGFIARSGQYQMMHAALITFLRAKSSDDENRDGSNLAQIEAGTGTGKTVAYCLAAIVASEILGKRVIVSTATVALQEQLFQKDLPRLAKIIPSLRFDVLKGRGRYLCESRIRGELMGDDDNADPQTGFLDGFEASQPKENDLVRDPVQSMRWFDSALASYKNGSWDGDVDTLDHQPDPSDWRMVQSSAQTCNGGACESFNSCAFFKARRQAATATLQVANHALILSTLQVESNLINPSETLFVFDEGHHLPSVASDQFSYRAKMSSSLQLLSALRTSVSRFSKGMSASVRPDTVAFGKSLTECMNSLASIEDYIHQQAFVKTEGDIHRFSNGVIPEELTPRCESLSVKLRAIAAIVDLMSHELSKRDENKSPSARDEQSRASTEMSVYHSKLKVMENLFISWATHDKFPLAKWIEGEVGQAGLDYWICASPMTAASLLSKGLWIDVSAAICTSATLTACGSFDYFDRMSGMNRFKSRLSLTVSSPFDYQKQSKMRIMDMKSDPTQHEAYGKELCAIFPSLLVGHKKGQLALFTSKRQMMACYEALPRSLMERVLMQGRGSRTSILAEHSRRIEDGEPSIIFGLQSFGEGVDLPGALCEHVLIDKIPFAPPSSPVDEALSEWLESKNRKPFTEISVPRAAMRLAQFTGRAVRTESDRALITVCDKRLFSKFYGRLILDGLPPYPVVREKAIQSLN